MNTDYFDKVNDNTQIGGKIIPENFLVFDVSIQGGIFL